MYLRSPYLHHPLSALEKGPVAGAPTKGPQSPTGFREPWDNSSDMTPSSQGAGPYQLPQLEGSAPWESQDQREKSRMRTRRSTPNRTTIAHHCRRSRGERIRRHEGGSTTPCLHPCPKLPPPRELTTCHMGHFGHLPEDPIHPGLGVVHLMSKGVQHAAKTKMV